MTFLKKGEINWKHILIVIGLATFIGGGAFWLSREQEVPFIEPPKKEINCRELSEKRCRGQSICVALGKAILMYLETGEEETFSFEECVERFPEYKDCIEVVRMTQMRGGSQYPKECRCCCGEGPFCEERSYPER